MPRNTLGDLNNHLFEQLERLNEESLTDEELDKEIKRAASIEKISQQIISNARVVLEATKHVDEYYGGGVKNPSMPKMLLGNDDK